MGGSIKPMNDAEKVREVIRRYPAGLSIAEIIDMIPDVPRHTIDAALMRMVRDGEAVNVVRGFYRYDSTYEAALELNRLSNPGKAKV